MFEKYASILGEHCKNVFQDMTRLEVLKLTVRKDDKPDEMYAIGKMLPYQDMDKKLHGTFNLGFTDKEAAVLVASAISTNLGLGAIDEMGEIASDILGEFINTIMGHTISEWDKLGLRVKFGLPVSLQDSSAKEKKRLATNAFMIFLQLKKDCVVFRLTVTQSSMDKMAGKRILIADDSLVMRNILQKYCIEHEAETELAEDGLLAVEKYKTFHPDLTIMDINMPKLDGLEAIRQIRSIDSEAKFIILSSSSRQDQMVTAKLLNISTYLIKPFNADTFMNAVNKVLD